MLLAIDIGNTNITLGLFDLKATGVSAPPSHHWRVETARARTADEFGILFKQLFDLSGIRFEDVGGIAISNVVPTLQHILGTMCQRYFEKEPFWVDSHTARIPMRVDRPEEAGADRLCNAVGAWEKYGKACVVVDFGTATTFDVVTAKGEYGGGAIAPGIGIANLALTHAASRLPRVEISKPKRVVGRNTVECIQAGVYHGYVGLVDRLVRMTIAEEQTPLQVIATGGLASLIAQDSETIQTVDRFLTLEGIFYIWKKHL